MGQAFVIERWILSSKRETESALAILVAVAGAHVTTGFREHRHHVSRKRRRFGIQHSTTADRQGKARRDQRRSEKQPAAKTRQALHFANERANEGVGSGAAGT